MDMSSLSNGLPRPAEDPINIAFKEAALSITTLYKASQKSRREGYLDALDDMWRLFFADANTEADVDITKLATWLNEQKRTSQTKQDTTDVELETEVVTDVPSTPAREASLSPVRTERRHDSPTRLRTDHDRQERAGEAGETREGRRERQGGVKRRVVGTLGVVPDFHKRGRYG